MDKKNKGTFMSEENRKNYIEGLKRYSEKGIAVFIDGEVPSESDWDKIMEIHEDGCFYMPDYVYQEKEPRVLTEIHFDRVYHEIK